MENGDQGEILLMKCTALMKVNNLTTLLCPGMLKPNEKASLIFSTLEESSTGLGHWQVYDAGKPDPSNCHTTTSKSVAVVGKISTAVLQIRNSNSQPCKISANSITCELESKMKGTRLRSSIKRRGQSQYDISYQPTNGGQHWLYIKVDDQDIKGSPYHVPATSLPTLTVEEVWGPQGLEISKAGEIIVAEEYEHCVSVFSPNGKKLRSFGKDGKGQQQFCVSKKVIVDKEGSIFVADPYNNQIQKFTAEGELLKVICSESKGPLQFNLSSGLTFNARNNKVYVSGRHCQILILNSDLSYYSKFEGHRNSSHLACNSNGNIYCDYDIFTAEGKFLKSFKRKDGRKLCLPSGIAY